MPPSPASPRPSYARRLRTTISTAGNRERGSAKAGAVIQWLLTTFDSGIIAVVRRHIAGTVGSGV
jgi:hypothetical protein